MAGIPLFAATGRLDVTRQRLEGSTRLRREALAGVGGNEIGLAYIAHRRRPPVPHAVTRAAG